MKKIKPEDLFNLPFYSAQAGKAFSRPEDAYAHYRHKGQALGLMPSPFFYTAWHMWQNPGAAAYATCLDHFLAEGCRAPAPFLDSAEFLKANPAYGGMDEALAALASGRDKSISPNLEYHLRAQAERQKEIHNSINAEIIARKDTGRKNLVWIQSGPGVDLSPLAACGQNRPWDLLCSWYSLQSLDLSFGEIHVSQAGTKTTAISHMLKHWPELLARYDYILFLDDDIKISPEDIDRLFDFAKNNALELFQPGLKHGSHGVWRDLFGRYGGGAREVSGIEIMMPCFSSRALFQCAPDFERSISGYGADFRISERARANGLKCHVLDSILAAHVKPIDEDKGSFYRFMRNLGINPALELYSAIHELGRFPDFRTL